MLFAPATDILAVVLPQLEPIRGFGIFKMGHREARSARTPKIGEPAEVPARAAPVF